MYTIMQSLRVKGSAGDPLPTVWRSLPPFLRGHLGLVCAGAGTGKSAFVFSYAMQAAVPALYFSADSDAYTQLTRAVSMLTGWQEAKASAAVRRSDLSAVAGDVEDLPIRFNYNASPSLDDIENSMQAYIQGYGDYPSLVVVDNITNVRTGGADDDNPFDGLEGMMDYLHTMARNTGAFVLGLHHVTGPYNDGAKPIPLSGVKGQISRVPELILTLHRVPQEFGPDLLNVSTVKNRSGRADASGESFVSLRFDGDTMRIEEN